MKITRNAAFWIVTIVGVAIVIAGMAITLRTGLVWPVWAGNGIGLIMLFMQQSVMNTALNSRK